MGCEFEEWLDDHFSIRAIEIINDLLETKTSLFEFRYGLVRFVSKKEREIQMLKDQLVEVKGLGEYLDIKQRNDLEPFEAEKELLKRCVMSKRKLISILKALVIVLTAPSVLLV